MIAWTHAVVLVLLALGCSDAAPGQRPDRQQRAPVASPRPAPGRAPEMRARRRVPAPRRPAPVESETLAVLTRGLGSPDYATRLFATEAYGCIPGRDALEALARQLGDPEADVRAAAIAALHRHDVPAASRLLRSVRDDTDEELSLRVQAAAALVSPSPSCH